MRHVCVTGLVNCLAICVTLIYLSWEGGGGQVEGWALAYNMCMEGGRSVFTLDHRMLTQLWWDLLCQIPFELAKSFDSMISQNKQAMIDSVCQSRHTKKQIYDSHATASHIFMGNILTRITQVVAAQYLVQTSRFEFLLWGRGLILYWSIKIPNLSHYKMMVLNPQRIAENDNMILLQNEDWFLSWGYLKGKFHHYKMTIGFYHQVTWRGHSSTTKWRLVFICFYHQVTWRENFNTTKWQLNRLQSICVSLLAQLVVSICID